jgi:hypothetical protein
LEGGMTGFCKQFDFKSIDDIIALSALYRPGPMDLIPDYIKRKKGLAKIKYEHPLLEEVCAGRCGPLRWRNPRVDEQQRCLVPSPSGNRRQEEPSTAVRDDHLGLVRDCAPSGTHEAQRVTALGCIPEVRHLGLVPGRPKCFRDATPRCRTDERTVDQDEVHRSEPARAPAAQVAVGNDAPTLSQRPFRLGSTLPQPR